MHHKIIPTIKILDSKINLKDKYTKMQNTVSTFFLRVNKQPQFYSNFIPFIIKKENFSNHSQVILTKFQLINFTSTTKIKIDNISICQTLNLDQFKKFFRVTISSINYMKHSNSDFNYLHVYKNSPYKKPYP